MALKVVLPVLFVGAGWMGMQALVDSREVPTPKAAVTPTLGVEVQTVRLKATPLTLTWRGIVEPAEVVALAAQTSGVIASVAKGLNPGARVDKGDVLVRLDRRRLKLEVDALTAEVERAQGALEIEEGAGAASEKEWALYGKGKEGSKRLATRAPQRQISQAALEVARARLAQAKLELGRATVRAPFDALVRDVRASRGQFVTPQAGLVTLAAADRFWVRARVPLSELGMVERGREVTVLGSRGKVKGTLLGLEGDVESTTRTARALVEVPKPLEAPGLLLGGRVEVEVEATELGRAAMLPERAVYDGTQVYVCDEASKLRGRTIEVARRLPGSVLVRAGLQDGDRVIVTRLAAPIEGMALTCGAQSAGGEASP